MQSLSNANDIFFTEIEKTIPECVWNHKRLQIAKAMLRNKKEGITRLDFKLHYKATIIRVVLAQKQTHRQWNRRRSPEISPLTRGQLIYNKEGKNVMGERQTLQ